MTGLSDTRSMVGTEGYFAPEGTGQPRCDVYSLGKVLYGLADSLVAEARAVRLSGQAGARENALAAVRRGLRAGAPLFDLRTQAASAPEFL